MNHRNVDVRWPVLSAMSEFLCPPFGVIRPCGCCPLFPFTVHIIAKLRASNVVCGFTCTQVINVMSVKEKGIYILLYI